MTQYESADYRRLLDSCLEIEGLLSLLCYRGDESPEEILPLLRTKVTALANALDLGPDTVPCTLEAEEAPDSLEIAASVEYEEAADADEHAPGQDTAQPVSLAERLGRTAATDLRQAFSLNDRYRFRRELFAGSDAAMADTLDLLTAMHSLREAEEYLYGDLGWDPLSPDVHDFMSVIQRYFSSQTI